MIVIQINHKKSLMLHISVDVLKKNFMNHQILPSFNYCSVPFCYLESLKYLLN